METFSFCELVGNYLQRTGETSCDISSDCRFRWFAHDNNFLKQMVTIGENVSDVDGDNGDEK